MASSTCTEHPTEAIRFFCDECKVFICDDCVTGQGNHAKCTKTKLREYGKKQRQSMQERTTKAIDTKLPRIKKLIEQIEKEKTSFNESVDKEIESIRSKRELVRNIFDEIEEDLIKEFEDARKAANDEFDELTKLHTQQYDKIKEITDDVQSKGSDIPGTDIAIYDSKLTELLDSNPLPETIRKIERPKHDFHEDYVVKDNLRHIIGHLDYGKYDQPDSVDMLSKFDSDENREDRNEGEVILSIIPTELNKEEETSDETDSDFYAKSSTVKTPNKYVTVKSFQHDGNVSYIVPQEKCYQVWLIGSEIWDLDFTSEKPNLLQVLSSLDGKPFTAGRSKKHGLLIGINNKKSIKQLQVSSGTTRKIKMAKLVSHINAHSQYLAAICTASASNKDIAICLKDYPLSGNAKENQMIIRWFSAAKLRICEISLPHSKVEVESPVYMSEHMNGDICITCSPDNKSSWVILIDEKGNQKMRYPPKDTETATETILYSFIGAAFLKDGSITILDRVKFRQHLINEKGEVLRIDNYKNQPSCFAVDHCDYIWVGFDDGQIHIMEYNNGFYEDIEVKTQL